MWVLIGLVPGHCILVAFRSNINDIFGDSNR